MISDQTTGLIGDAGRGGAGRATRLRRTSAEDDFDLRRPTPDGPAGLSNPT